MIRKIKVLNMYSDLNIDLDIVVVVNREEETQQAEQIINKAHDDWFELVKNKEETLFCDYLETQLKQAHIGYQLYVKAGDSL